MSGKRQNEEQFPEAKRPKGHSESREPESKRSLRADYGTGETKSLSEMRSDVSSLKESGERRKDRGKKESRKRSAHSHKFESGETPGSSRESPDVCNSPKAVKRHKKRKNEKSSVGKVASASYKHQEENDSSGGEEYYDANSSPPSHSDVSRKATCDENAKKDDGVVDTEARRGHSQASEQQKQMTKPISKEEKFEASTRTHLSAIPKTADLCIEFHVLLHQEWKFDPEKGHKVGIAFGHEWLGDWKESAVVMDTECILENNHRKLKGNLSLPLGLKCKFIPYKYVVTKGENKEDFEYIRRPRSRSKVVNRVLEVPERLQEVTGGRYRKYDDIIRLQPGIARNLKDKVLGHGFAYNRILAMEAMLPKWNGFVPGQSLFEQTQTTAHDALSEIDLVVQSIKCQRVCEDDCAPYNWELPEFSKQKVSTALRKHVSGQIQSFVERKEAVDGDIDALVSAVTIAVLDHKYKFQMTMDEVAGLLRAMALLPDMDQRTCPGLTLLKRHFDNVKETLDAIESLCRTACSKRAEWLFALPLVHFLKGDSAPFQSRTVRKSVVGGREKWWGLARLYESTKIFRREQANLKSAFDLLDSLRPLFRVDPLAGRAFLFVISLEQIAAAKMAFPLYEMITVLEEKVLDLNHKPKPWWSWTDGRENAKHLLKVLDALISQSLESSVDAYVDIEEQYQNAKVAVEASVRLLQCVATTFSTSGHVDVLVRCRDLVFSILYSFETVSVAIVSRESELLEISKASDTLIDKKFSKEQLNLCFKYVEKWLHQNTFSRSKETVKSLMEGMKLWNAIIQYDRRIDLMLEQWTNAIETSLKKKLQFLESSLLLTAARQIDDMSFHVAIKRCFDGSINKAVEHLPEVGSAELENVVDNYIEGVKRDQSRSTKTLGQIMKRIYVSRSSSSLEELRFLLSWKPWKDIILLTDGFSQSEQLLRSSCGVLEKALATLGETVSRLENGDITVEELDLVAEKESNLLKLCSACDRVQKENHLQEVARTYLRSRCAELSAFKRRKEIVNNFVGLYAMLELGSSLDVEDLSTAAKGDVRIVPINTLCKRSKSGNIRITYIPLRHELTFYLEKLEQYKRSKIFLRLWRQAGQKLKKEKDTQESQECQTLNEIIPHVCDPVFTEWQDLCRSVYDGVVTLLNVGRIFQNVLRNREGIEEQLRCIHSSHVDSNDRQWIKERATQIEQYGKLEHSMNAAKTIRGLCRKLKIPRTREIRNICAQDTDEFKQEQITVITPQLLSTSEFLASITEPQLKCLNAFMSDSAQSLVEWLRDDIGEWRELETFVDLATAKLSEEGDYEVSKVAHLYGACAAFAPLLFNVQRLASFANLQEACRTVFDFFAGDSHLPTKWEDSATHVEEFRAMRDSLSSVETSSFSQLEIINSRGVYQIGAIRCDSGLAPHDYTLDKCLKVEIASDENEAGGTVKSYSYSFLQDLESKLMLICGQNHQHRNTVDMFVEVLSRTVRLANVFIDLANAGHDAYLQWTKSFSCCSVNTRGFSISLDTSDEDMDGFPLLLEKMGKEADEMKECLKNWVEKVEIYRKQYSYLNFFTTPQVLVLRRELGLVVANARSTLPNDVFSLLMSVRPNCNFSDVKEALGVVRGYAAAQNIKPIFRQGVAEPTWKEKDVQLLQDMGFARRRALRSLQLCDGDPERALTMCLDYGDQGVMSDVEDMSVGDVTFAEPTVSSVTTMMSGVVGASSYLSMDVLGQILQLLAPSSPQPLKRSFSICSFRAGEPNLISAPRNEVLPTVLELYMIDTRMALPTAHEVLLCSSSTSIEEVCLLWRRAIADPTRLFCLAMADKLSYEVSQKSWEKINEFMHSYDISKPVDFKFAVVCSAEKDDKSYLVNALETYRRHTLPSPSARHLQKYFKAIFIQKSKEVAASLDTENSSVRVVRSSRAGVGKTSFVKAMADRLGTLSTNRCINLSPVTSGEEKVTLHVMIPLHEKDIDVDDVVKKLRPFCLSPDRKIARIIHIDVSPLVCGGVDSLVFNLLILGQLSDTKGNVWRKQETDMYVIEITRSQQPLPGYLTPSGSVIQVDARLQNTAFSLIDCLPTTLCTGPVEVLQSDGVSSGMEDAIVDHQFRSCDFQRVYQYLLRLSAAENLDRFKFQVGTVEGSQRDCLAVLLQNCGVSDPSWSEIKRFVSFLSHQLRDCDHNDFCNPVACGEDLPGFKQFVLKLMIRMSIDFAAPSLNVHEPALTEKVGILEKYQLRRRWEHSPHPYLFFNEDRQSVSFFGVKVNRQGQLQDPNTDEVLDPQLISPQLCTALYIQGFRLEENYDQWDKARKINELCRVMGVQYPFDHDESYELTMDNVKKILAIHMRFRCGIPVVVMGETGCGKTRLIKYMCKLQSNLTGAKNMLLMKVHGGVTNEDITNKVLEAERLAEHNEWTFPGYKIQTVLFFDEANTTDALGLIKEIMCDGRLNGRKISHLGTSLQIIAACNPYRKHTDDMIQRLEAAGLGFHVRAEDTDDRLGRIPLRQLVYRVHPLPASMTELVWDFGQLNPGTEKLYIRQIVARHVKQHLGMDNADEFVNVLVGILATAQCFMRDRNDECSFVSLRDVERAMIVICWFYDLRDVLRPLVHKKCSEHVVGGDPIKLLSSLTRSVVLALAVCYHARLKDRKPFREVIAKQFQSPCNLHGGANRLDQEIRVCQEVFLDELEFEPQIARNHALSENVFMMLVCIDLRIPLFLVGKPGSSKSLAKDIVKTNMKGHLSHSKLLRSLKQLHMASYQCSPLSTAEGIIGVFEQCQRLQNDNDEKRYVSCVVLDEVGLAEDSPRLPLKALHPLLDDGTTGADSSEEDDKAARVAFVGLSNWALDPAKMNRGILVNREEPDDDDLIFSAKGICSSDDQTLDLLMPYLEGMAKAYRRIYGEQKEIRSEFFGLRDYYSLVKMLYGFCKQSQRQPTRMQIEHAIRRNFGGQDDVDVLRIFYQCCNLKSNTQEQQSSPTAAIDNTTIGLIRAATETGRSKEAPESRYVLLLTDNYAALNIVRQQVLLRDDAVIIFGSGFPKDQEYGHICRTINRIKVCMATGRAVVLLNLDKLYESLYDALNQYYVRLGGQKFVDLGLGSHRVKCQVHEDFRLILVAERDAVYKYFPIPLINRMEKHCLSINSVLSHLQKQIVERVKVWVQKFSVIKSDQSRFETGNEKQNHFKETDAFIGYHKDAVATIVLQSSREIDARKVRGDALESEPETSEDVFHLSCEKFLCCATPDSIARLPASDLSSEAEAILSIYYEKLPVSNLADFVKFHTSNTTEDGADLLMQVTTHSRLFSFDGITDFGNSMKVEGIALQQFDTEQQFCNRIKELYNKEEMESSLLAVQCELGEVSSDMISCARYLIQEAREEGKRSRKSNRGHRHLVLIVQVSRMSANTFTGFQGGFWIEAHIDDLRQRDDHIKMPSVRQLTNRTMSSLLLAAIDDDYSQRPPVEPSAPPLEEVMEVDDSQEIVSEEGVAMEVDSNPDMLYNNQTLLDSYDLIQACIHGAVSRLDDPEADVEKTSQRIRVLLSLTETSECCRDSETFSRELVRRISKLLKEKETRMDPHAAAGWVRNEALSHRSIQAGGTFKRALWLRIVDVVTPILSEILALLDSNSNLSLMRDGFSKDGSWIRTLWLDLFCCPHFGQLSYDNFVSPVQGQIRQRVTVASSGYRGQSFMSKFPFSNLVKNELDEMMQKASNLSESSHERLDIALQRLVASSTVGRILSETIENSGANKDNLIRRYLHDFVRMVYKASSAKEYELVESAIECGVKEMASLQPLTDEIIDVSLTLSTIHASFQHVRRRLYLFRDMIRNRSDIVKHLHRETRGAGEEMVIDGVAAGLLLEELSTKVKHTSNERRRDWLRLMQVTKSIMESWLTVPLSDLPQQSARKALTLDIRTTWSVLSVVALFAEHIQHLSPDPFLETVCLKFYQCLCSVDIDFTRVHTIQAVQRFLDKINKEFGEKLLKCNEQCAICLDAWTEKEPARLPCGHAYCYECIKPHIRGRPVCPTCQLRVPETYDCRSDDNLKLASIRYREFKRSITAFFMELVSVWSFSETAAGPPDRELVHLLLELVVQKRLPHLEGPRTRPFSPFEEDTFDSRPVVRSFLLQLLLKYSARLTIDYVSRIFHEAQAFLGSSRIEGVDDLSVIFVQCMEDALERKACLSSAANWSQLVSSELRLSVERLNPSAQPVDRLLGIAGLRFSLAALSAIVVDILRDDEFEHQSRYNFLSSQSKLRPHEIETLISKAKEACNAVNDPQVVLFFLKQLVRRHGMDIIQKMRDRPHLAWICDIGQMDDATVPDFFAVTQFPYLDVRKAVAEVLLTGDVEYLKRMLKESRKRSRNAVLSAMLLAFYTEVTLKTTRNQPQLQIVQSIEESLGEDKRIPEWCKCLASDLLHNAQGRRLGRLEVSRGQSIQHLSLSGLALHIFVALSFSRRSNLIEPLRLILTEPQNMTNSYFPTMPEDVYIEARELVAGTKWYQCKNGHPYLVADCGRPVVSFQCTDCNEPIGDRTRDADARTHDTTQTGHILGPANQRAHAAPERSLSLSGYALVRLLLHAALMWASCSEDQNVSSGVADCTSPRVNENDLPEYFWSHFVHDVEVFSKTIGRSVQDAVVVCHEMLKRIVIGGEKAADTQVGTRLTSKNERKTWESLINQKLISPLLQSIPADIDEWLQRVMNDKCSVNNPVLRQVYELENPSASRFSSQLWRYRVRVSIEHLVNAIDQTLDPGQPTHCSLLKEFFAEESKLRALQYLPDILKLQTILATKCNRRFSQQEALTMTVDDFIRSLDDPAERQMFTKLLDSFVAAWQQVKEKVLNHGRLKPKKTKEHELQNVCGQTPIAFLLPRTQDEGTCALALVDYLINCTHNEFMGKYRRITGNEREAERVSMADMTVAHLIAYDVERDLMPLIFAHCDYTLAVGEGTKITYNLLALERQIADRFIVGKPHIDMEVCSVSYRKDVYNMALFARLTQRVTQEDLDASAERQIVAEMRDLRDIYSVLALLDIVIGFLASSGGEEDMTLDHYVHETLRMPRASSLISNKARQVCQLKHVRALWRLLNVEKSKRLTLADREPFEGVSPKYRHRLGKSARESLKIALKKIRIDVFLTELVDVVILELEKWQETSNIEEYELAAALEELHGSTMGGLNEISGDVKLKHIVHCWSLAVKLQAQMTRV